MLPVFQGNMASQWPRPNLCISEQLVYKSHSGVHFPRSSGSSKTPSSGKGPKLGIHIVTKHKPSLPDDGRANRSGSNTYIYSTNTYIYSKQQKYTKKERDGGRKERRERETEKLTETERDRENGYVVILLWPVTGWMYNGVHNVITELKLPVTQWCYSATHCPGVRGRGWYKQNHKKKKKNLQLCVVHNMQQ